MGAHGLTAVSAAPGARPRRGGAQIIPRPEVWTPGARAVWLGEQTDPEPRSVDEVLSAVAQHTAPRPLAPFAEARNSAVLVALLDGEFGAEVLLTRRSWHLRNHKGEISFPGGRMDPGETPAEAALREAWEEVGLEPERVQVAGELDHLNTFVSNSYIVPVLGRLSERPELKPAVAEVERIMFVPLVELARADTHREEIWHLPESDLSIQFFELDDETVWGATARMLVHLLSLVYGPPATRTAL